MEAIDAINGEILKPGESFSYNECLLSKRSSDNDYKEYCANIQKFQPVLLKGENVCL